MADAYASGSWHVQSGQEDEFRRQWLGYIEWGQAAHPEGFERARLLQEDSSRSHFVSFIEWEGDESRSAWAEDPELPERVARLVDLCDQVDTGAYSEAARVD